jgi:hypothetical protein
MGHIVQAASTAFQPCAVGFPLGMEQFWSLRDYSFTLQALMRRLIKRSFTATRHEVLQRHLKGEKNVSAGHLKKQCLINLFSLRFAQGERGS